MIPNLVFESLISPGNRYMITESFRLSIASSISTVILAKRVGDSLHSKTENCVRCPYFSQISAMRRNLEAPEFSVSAMSYVTRMSIASMARQMEDMMVDLSADNVPVK